MIASLLIDSFFLLRLFLLPDLFAKYILIIIFFIILYLCYTYPRGSTILLLKNPFDYAIKTKLAHIYNILVLSTYISVFICGIFYLRYSNRETAADLKYYYSLVEKLFKECSWHEAFVNGFLIILFGIVWMTLLVKLMQYFKLHLIKRHIYLVGGQVYGDKWYPDLHRTLALYLPIKSVSFNIQIKIENFYGKYYYNFFSYPRRPDNYFNLTEEEQNAFLAQNPVQPDLLFHTFSWARDFLNFILTKSHYVLLFVVMLYDIDIIILF